MLISEQTVLAQYLIKKDFRHNACQKSLLSTMFCTKLQGKKLIVHVGPNECV